MSELIRNEIGENKISPRIGEVDTLEAKIKDSYKEIFDKTQELQGLKADISRNLTGENLKNVLENELTTDHVKNVLQQAVAKFETGGDMVGFNKVYGEMGAGLTFNMQLALAKLGCKFDSGIDGLYGSKDTKKRVVEFQNAWNAQYPNQRITPDGRAGKQTLKKIIAALDDPKWDKAAIGVPAAIAAPRPVTDNMSTRLGAESTENKPKVKKEKAPETPLAPKPVVDNVSSWFGSSETAPVAKAEKKKEKTKKKVETPVVEPKKEVKETVAPNEVVISENLYYPITIDLNSYKNGRYSYKQYSTSGQTLSEEQVSKYMTDKEKSNLIQLEDKSFKFNEIFRLEDFKDVKQAKKIDKFINWFNIADGIAKASMSIDDVRIAVVKGKKYVEVDYDNRGGDNSWSENRRFEYKDVFNDAGFLQRDTFLKKVRKDILDNVLPQIKD